MKLLASLAIAVLAQQSQDATGSVDERGFDYGGFGDYDLSAFDSSYGFDDSYTGVYDYSADVAPAEATAGRETEVDGDESDKRKGERYFFTTATTTTTTTTTTTATVDSVQQCWKCDAMTYATCASGGDYENCSLGDKDCCFIEVRTTHTKLQQLCTGCKDKTACEDNKAENFEGTNMDDAQCRPQMLQQKTNSRHQNQQSVCRQCFNTCDSTVAGGAFCFGSIATKTPVLFQIRFADGVGADGVDRPTATAKLEMSVPHGRADWADVIGIPTGVMLDALNTFNSVQINDIEGDNPLNVFFGNNVDGKLKPSGPGDGKYDSADMTFWSVLAGNEAWWKSDLKALQVAGKAAQAATCNIGTTGVLAFDDCTATLVHDFTP